MSLPLQVTTLIDKTEEALDRGEAGFAHDVISRGNAAVGFPGVTSLAEDHFTFYIMLVGIR